MIKEGIRKVYSEHIGHLDSQNTQWHMDIG